MDIVEVREGDVIERPLSIDEKLRLHCEWQEKDHTNGDYFHLLAKEAAATITALRARVAELERVGRETSEYLRKLEANMLENDADMMLDDCLPPSFHADQIDAALTRIKEATP